MIWKPKLSPRSYPRWYVSATQEVCLQACGWADPFLTDRVVVRGTRMVEQLHAPRAVVSKPRRAINEQLVLECKSPYVHAVAESILRSRTGLLHRARVHRQESTWWHIEPSNISLAVVPRCLECQVSIGVVLSLFAQALQLFVSVELVQHEFQFRTIPAWY